MDTKDLKAQLVERLAFYKSACELAETEEATLTLTRQKLSNREESRKVFQEVSKAVQEAAHARIASVVSKCLETVFDSPYEFHIKFETKRGRTEAQLVFLRDGIEVDPMSASGGGVVDVASFALRLACLSLSRPPLRKLLVLDEPFKFVSKDYRRQIRQLLETLADEMGFQFFFVTHIPDLQCGRIVTVP
jgi:DNA repair exonuclease SbcCD ATPase subunit